MKKLNNNGFVLAETLVVTVFIMTIFTILYNNFFPLIGEYEKREYYDDVDSKYQVFWLKNFAQHSDFQFPNLAASNGFAEYNITKDTDYDNDDDNAANDNDDVNNRFCALFKASAKTQKQMCLEFCRQANVDKIVLTNYNITNYKSSVSDEDGWGDYINYLPNYKNPSLNGAKYRVIARFKRQKEDQEILATDTNKEDYFYAYSTIEVNRNA